LANTAAQEKAQSYKDEDVTKGTLDINIRHAQMGRTDATKELRAHEPNVHIESEVHVARAKAMINMADDYKYDESQTMFSKTAVKKDPPTFTKPLANINAKEGQSVRLVLGH